MKKVLLILVDQWRWDLISALGANGVVTPNLDKLVENGVSFRNHFSVTIPCGPSRSSILTGMYAMNHRAITNGTPLDSKFDNLALSCRRNSLEPILVGYTTTTPDPRTTSELDPSFRLTGDTMAGFKPLVPYHAKQDSYLAELKSKGISIPSNTDDLWKPEQNKEIPADRGFCFSPSRLSVDEYDNAFYTDKAIKHLSVRENRDWLMLLTYMRPHPPYVAPDPYHKMFDPNSLDMPLDRADLSKEATQHPFLEYLLKTEKIEDYAYGKEGLIAQLPDLDVKQIKATYFGMLAELDAQIGRVINYLKKSDQISETLIIFTSDHGEMLGDHRLFGKHAYFDASYRVPLIVVDPSSINRGGQIFEFTESVDLMPTILDWLDFEIPRQCDGCSLMPFIRGEKPKNWRSGVMLEFDYRSLDKGSAMNFFNTHFDDCSVAIYRNLKGKYVHFNDLDPLLFSYDISHLEQVNLASDKRYLKLKEELMSDLITRRLSKANTSLTHFQAGEKGLLRFI